jgi:hypothetical protein
VGARLAQFCGQHGQINVAPPKLMLLGLNKRSKSRRDASGASHPQHVLFPVAGEFARIGDLRKAGRPPRCARQRKPAHEAQGVLARCESRKGSRLTQSASLFER